MKEVCYVLFNNHENGLKLHKILRANGLKATISPTPRVLTKCCGVSLIIDKEEIETIRKLIQENSIEILSIESIEVDINPNRDRYC